MFNMCVRVRVPGLYGAITGQSESAAHELRHSHPLILCHSQVTTTNQTCGNSGLEETPQKFKFGFGSSISFAYEESF